MILATAEITISHMIDIVGTYRFYQLVNSGTILTKPTGEEYPPPNLLYNTAWEDTEPTYSGEEEDRALYYVDCTVYSNGTCSYSPVSLSTSYELAKEAQNSADEAHGKLDNMIAWNHTAFSIDEGKTLVETVINSALESGAISDDGTDDDEISGHYRTGYIKVIPGETYAWTVTDNEVAMLPTTFFYESDNDTTFTFLSYVNTSSIEVPSSSKNVYVRASLLSASEIENIDGKLTLYDLDSHLNDGAVLYLGETTTLDQSPPWTVSAYVWSLPDNEMQAYMADLLKALDESFTGNLNELSDKLYASGGSIPALQESLGAAHDRLDVLDGYVTIIPKEATIKLGEKYSSAKVVITNKNISFQNNGVEGARIGYVDDEKTSMMASSIHVTENFPRAKVDGTWVGNLCWIARSNGHLSLKVVE